MSRKRRSKRYRAATEQVDRTKRYTLQDAVTTLQQLVPVKFDESVDLSIALHVDPKRSDQLLRGTVVLPHGTGKSVRVAVVCQGEQVAQAKAAGADEVGSEELIKKMGDGWLDFDVCIASPSMMRELAKVAKILGPRGLMPSPKAGTVTDDVAKAVQEVKAGKVTFRQDKQANLHIMVGRRSFEAAALAANAGIACQAVARARPNTLRGPLVRSATLSSTMSPGIPLDSAALFAEGVTE